MSPLLHLRHDSCHYTQCQDPKRWHRGGVSSIYPHGGLWTAPNPSLLSCTGKLFLLAQVCSPASLFLPYHLLPLDGCSFSSPQVYIPGHRKKGKKGPDLPFLVDFPEIPLNSSAYVSLAITWSQDYQLAVETGGKEKLCLSKNWDSSRVATCNTCDHTTSYSTYSSLTFFSLQINFDICIHSYWTPVFIFNYFSIQTYCLGRLLSFRMLQFPYPG